MGMHNIVQRPVVKNGEIVHMNGYGVLEVGSGTGAICRALSARPEFSGAITGVDQSAVMVNCATTLAADAGLAHVIDFRVGDAQDLEFGDDTFDTAVHALAFSPDSSWFAFGAGDGGVILMRDFAEGDRAVYAAITAHDSWAFSLIINDDGSLITGGGDNRVVMWDAQFQEDRVFKAGGHTNDVHAVVLSADGKTLYSVGDDRRLIAWSVADGSVVNDIEPHTEQVPVMRRSPDGRVLATGSRDDAIRLFRASDLGLIRTIDSHHNDILDLAFSPAGGLIASASYDTRVLVHDTQTGELRFTLDGHKDRVFAVAYHPDGATLATGGEDNDIILYDASNNYTQHKRIDTDADVSRLAYSPDGKWLAAASSNGDVHIYNSGTYEVAYRFQYTALVDPEPPVPVEP